MYSFLVLGMVPGTNIQITFQGWISIMMAIVALVLIVKLVALQFRVTTTDDNLTSRAPLHASQLHQRLQTV